MLKKFFPKQKIFFDGFNLLGNILLNMSEALVKALEQDSFNEGSINVFVQEKERAKKEAKNLFTETHKTFITPFDRQDIHNLNSEIYDAINTINLTTQRFLHYKLHIFPDNMRKLVVICRDAAILVAQILRMLENLNNQTEILKVCHEIKEHESHGDQLLFEGIAELYDQQDDIKMILKLKEVYGLLESVTDRYQKIAYIVEGIILEYA